MTSSNVKIKNALENDPAVIYQLDPEFWTTHAPAHLYMNARKRKAFIKRKKELIVTNSDVHSQIATEITILMILVMKGFGYRCIYVLDGLYLYMQYYLPLRKINAEQTNESR